MSLDPRKRKNTANTVLAQMKAILNRAYEHGYINSNWAWVCVRPFKNVSHVARPGYLERDQIKKLIDAARPDAARVIKGGLITGCRIGDLLKMQVEDYLRAKNRIVVFALKTQNLHHIALSEEGVEFFNEITKDRPRDEPMFITDNHQRWTRYRFRVQFLKAQEEAGVSPTITFHTLRHTYASYAAQWQDFLLKLLPIS